MSKYGLNIAQRYAWKWKHQDFIFDGNAVSKGLPSKGVNINMQFKKNKLIP